MTERCHCGGQFTAADGLVPLLRCVGCGRELPATAITTSARIPLRARDGSVHAWAIVDAADHDALNSYRWRLHPAGYAQRGTQRKGVTRSYLMHRDLLGLEQGDGLQADHINGDRLDNRRCNLRVCVHAENAQNRRYGYGSSRARGVYWNTERGWWQAYGKLNGKMRYLGCFDSEEDAAATAAAWRAKHMPFSSEAAA